MWLQDVSGWLGGFWGGSTAQAARSKIYRMLSSYMMTHRVAGEFWHHVRPSKIVLNEQALKQVQASWEKNPRRRTRTSSRLKHLPGFYQCSEHLQCISCRLKRSSAHIGIGVMEGRRHGDTVTAASHQIPRPSTECDAQATILLTAHASMSRTRCTGIDLDCDSELSNNVLRGREVCSRIASQVLPRWTQGVQSLERPGGQHHLQRGAVEGGAWEREQACRADGSSPRVVGGQAMHAGLIPNEGTTQTDRAGSEFKTCMGAQRVGSTARHIMMASSRTTAQDRGCGVQARCSISIPKTGQVLQVAGWALSCDHLQLGRQTVGMPKEQVFVSNTQVVYMTCSRACAMWSHRIDGYDGEIGIVEHAAGVNQGTEIGVVVL